MSEEKKTTAEAAQAEATKEVATKTEADRPEGVKTDEVLLSVDDLYVNYGVIPALKGISFEVKRGEVVALIGANGAGKTTILHTVTGLVEKKTGTVTLGERTLQMFLPTRS